MRPPRYSFVSLANSHHDEPRSCTWHSHLGLSALGWEITLKAERKENVEMMETEGEKDMRHPEREAEV